MRSQRSAAGSRVPRVRKRVSVGYSQIPAYASGRWDPDDSKAAKATAGAKVRNFCITIAVFSFPIGIFMLPLLLRASAYPRVVISLTTIPDRLPHIRPTLESLLYQQSYAADAVYLVLPQQDYYSKQPLKYEPWPDFLQEMILTTNLEILQPTFDYGPASKVLYALDEETSRLKQQAEDTTTTTTTTTTEPTTTTPATRIVYLDDDIQYHHLVVRQLVDASLEADGDVVALSGGLLRDQFRQLKHSNLKYDRPPNLYMHVSGKRRSEWRQVDIVQGFTAVCVPITMNTQVLHKVLQDPSISTHVVKSDDILLSAAMELQNMTRWVVPGGGTPRYTNSTTIRPLSKGMHMNLMEAVFYVQQEFRVWQDYTFLNLKELTKEQLNAIDCEAAYEQECSGEICWPNPTKCPDARAVLEVLTWKDDGEA
jgi:hypothetical protein